MTEWQSFRTEVRAGSSQQDEELDFKINSETEDGLVREKQDRDWPERLVLKLNFIASPEKLWWTAPVFSKIEFKKEQQSSSEDRTL